MDTNNILNVVVELGVEPWLGKADWVKVGEYMGITKNAARNRYRREKSKSGPGWKIQDVAVEVGSRIQTTWIPSRLMPSTDNLLRDLVRQVGTLERSWSNPEMIQMTDYLFLPILFDLHLEKGNVTENIEFYTSQLQKLFARAQGAGYNPSRILYVVGNDLGNIDTPLGTTTKGTYQGGSMEIIQGFQTRASLVIACASWLLEHAPIDILIVPGNHDYYSNFYLGEVVKAWFRGNDWVSVNNADHPRKYYQYGSNLLMFTHGDKEPHATLPAIMATEQPQAWGNTRNREVFTGHSHKRSSMSLTVNENHGVLVRSFPSLGTTDRWHKDKGYVGNKRGGVGLVYDLKQGQVAEFYALE